MAWSWRLGLELQDHKQLPSERCVSHLSDAATRRRRPENPGGGPGTGQRAAQKSFAGQSCTQPASFRHSHDSATSIHHDRTRPTTGSAASLCRTVLPLPRIMSKLNIRQFLAKGPARIGEGIPCGTRGPCCVVLGTFQTPAMLADRSRSELKRSRRPWQRPCKVLSTFAGGASARNLSNHH